MSSGGEQACYFLSLLYLTAYPLALPKLATMQNSWKLNLWIKFPCTFCLFGLQSFSELHIAFISVDSFIDMSSFAAVLLSVINGIYYVGSFGIIIGGPDNGHIEFSRFNSLVFSGSCARHWFLTVFTKDRVFFKGLIWSILSFICPFLLSFIRHNLRESVKLL